MTTITCPHCGQRFGVAAHLYGKQVACSTCGGALNIPHPAPAQAVPQVPTQPVKPVAFQGATAPRGPSGWTVATVFACVIGALTVCCLVGGIGVKIAWDALSSEGSRESAIVDYGDRSSPAGPVTEEAGPPSVPDRFVFRPTFETSLGLVAAGRAFIVKTSKQSVPVALTAVHLLGPAGGLDRDVRGAEIPRVVQRVVLEECFDPSIEVDIGSQALSIPPVAPLGEPSLAGDVAAFWVTGSAAVTPLPLAKKDAVKGEQVWLAGPVIAGAPPERRLHAARVLAMEDRQLYFRYENASIELRATSGAPVLNARGEVVAINLGGGEMDGDLIGVSNPVSRFRSYLERATPPTQRASDAPAAVSPAPRHVPDAPVVASPPSRYVPVAPKVTIPAPRRVPDAAVSRDGEQGPSLVQRQAIYREAKLADTMYQRRLEMHERGRQQMMDAMSKSGGRVLESMKKSNEAMKKGLSESRERARDSLCGRYRITRARLAEILAEGDKAGWTVPGARPAP